MRTTATPDSRGIERAAPVAAARRWERLEAAGATAVSSQSVAALRVALGLVVAWSMLRYLGRGWVTTQLTDPEFHVTYPGLSWVRPLPAPWMQLVPIVVAVAAVSLACGRRQRLSAAVALVGFCWIELIDASTYLNHYELVTLLLAWAVVLPMSQASTVPSWVVWTLRAQLAVVYVFAGLAKLSTDWLVDAEPLRTWLAARTDMPVLGPIVATTPAAYVASWAGAVFDLAIVPLLCIRRTRPWAYGAVVVFHLVTWRLFPPIGVFPIAMILLTPIFFEPDWPTRVARRLRLPSGSLREFRPQGAGSAQRTGRMRPAAPVALACVAIVQVVVPMRHLAVGNDVRWDDQHYRWSWRVMVTERAGVATFEVVDPATGDREIVVPDDELPAHQVRYVSSRPEALRQFAVFLADRAERETGDRPAVHARAWVSVNGHRRALIVDPSVDLAAEGGPPDGWILPAPWT
ncbi:MAG TPA: HTTM domain-containing protein [Microthrixaceae bacterium]|nr:HTTM domain-containing protein [Microthrixaceae bacterium]